MITPTGGVLPAAGPDGDRQRLRRPLWTRPPVVQYGRTMQGYSSVPASLLGDTEALREWYDLTWEWIGTKKHKPTKKAATKPQE